MAEEIEEEEKTPEAPPKKKGVFRILRNKYLLVTLFFVAWMLFFDNNNWMYVSRLSEEVALKKTEKNWYVKEIKEAERQIHELTSDLQALEKFGRENYYMKKKDEDVYIFLEEADSTDHSH